jgi:hypothetical protein
MNLTILRMLTNPNENDFLKICNQVVEGNDMTPLWNVIKPAGWEQMTEPFHSPAVQFSKDYMDPYGTRKALATFIAAASERKSEYYAPYAIVSQVREWIK